MAMQLTKKLDNNVEVVDAYTRIIGVNFGERRGDSVSISVMTFKNKNARESGIGGIHSESHRLYFDRTIEIGAMTVHAWAYDKLKMLEMYEDAVDV